MDKIRFWRKEVLVVLFSAIFAVVVSLSVSSSYFSSILFGTTEVNDELFVDFYRKAAYRATGYKEHSSPIIIASIDNCNRQDLVAVINALEDKGVAAIGLDAYFRDVRHRDTMLISILKEHQNIIVPISIQGSFEEDSPSLCQYTYFVDDYFEGREGVVTHYIGSKTEPVKQYIPIFQMDSMAIPCFAYRIAEQYSSDAANRQYERFNRFTAKQERQYSEMIYYGRADFTTLDVQGFLSGSNEYAMDIVNEQSIVLLGSLYNTQDLFVTPVSQEMPGILVHAHILDTILNGYYLNRIPKVVSILFNLLILSIFICLYLLSKLIVFKYWNLVIRLAQIGLIFVIYLSGSILFQHMWTANIIQPIIIIGLMGVSYDIISGCFSIVEDLLVRIKH